MTDTFLRYQLSQLCQNAIQTCPFTNPVAGADCTRKFCTGFPAYIGVGTCVSLNYDPLNCCSSSDPTTCLQNFAHGSGSGSGGSGVPNVCASVISILDTCFTLTPSLSPSALVAISGPSATALASCACYDVERASYRVVNSSSFPHSTYDTAGTYDPTQFDDYASECKASGSAAHPTYFPLVAPLVGFCTNNANAATPGSTPATTTPPLAATASTPAGSSAVSAGVSSTSTSAGQAAATATNAAAITASSAASTSTAQTTTSKSGGVKMTLKTSAVLLLSFSMLFSFY